MICATKAKYFFDALGLEGNFIALPGWFKGFKQRHGIRELIIPGEILSSNKTVAEQFVKEFENLILKEGYLPEQIFNTDETCLDSNAYQPGFWLAKMKNKLLDTNPAKNN